jgi:hypothetical protein
MADFTFAYPAILTKRAWDKGKGKIAKLVVGKTDVGAALAAIEAETKAYFDGVMPFQGADPLDFVNYVQTMQKELANGARAISAKVTAAGPIIKNCIDDFAASKLTPRSSTRYAMDVQNALKPFSNDVMAFSAKVSSELLKDYKEKLSTLPAFLGVMGAAQTAKDTFDNVIKKIRKVESKPSLKNFNAAFKDDGPHRMYTTVCKQWDQVIAKRFSTLAASIYAGTAMNDFATKRHMMDVANEANFSASEVIQGMIDGGLAEDQAVTKFLLEYSKSCLDCKPILDHVKAVWAELKKYQ